jgi:hypothetical protein
MPDFALLALAIFAVLGAALLVVGTWRRNRWGLNLAAMRCPSCSSSLPSWRGPRTRQQALWGGWVCSTCLTVVDKWGREASQVGRGSLNANDPGVGGGGSLSSFLRLPWRKASSGQRIFTVLAIAADVAYDFYSPRAIGFDAIGICAILVWFYARRRGRTRE